MTVPKIDLTGENTEHHLEKYYRGWQYCSRTCGLARESNCESGIRFSSTARFGRNRGVGRMLSQRSAIVTGAGRGIGAAVARLLGQHGASVLVNDLDEAAAQASAAAVTAAGKRL